MTKWQELEESLRGVFGHAEIRAAGHVVTLRRRVYRERLVIEVGVDGWIKGEWSEAKDGKPVHPEGWFWWPSKSRLYPLKEHKFLRKAFGKRKADDMVALKVVAFMPYWTSSRSLINHLKKHFPDLEVTLSRAREEADHGTA